MSKRVKSKTTGRKARGRAASRSTAKSAPALPLSPALKSLSFPIVGIGASAGGLEAFMEMFKSLPPDTGLAFVLIQHLSPQHISMLSTFVQKATRMRVEEVKNGTRVEPNCIYVIPPNALLEIFHGVLHLSPMPDPHSGCMPVNTFFNSLARDQANLAIGIILSGTGSDGAHGLRDIKADGGITFVQEPESAKFDGMPRSAIAAATPDHVLSVEKISRELVNISRHPFAKKSFVFEEAAPTAGDDLILQKIFILVRSQTKIDFSTYKYPTINRRLRRRMVLHRVSSLAHYLKYLQENPKEVMALFEDLLINVTDFFRDAEAFDSLKARVFPSIMNGRAAGTPIRIWVPGCSTGEEVYSIAISLLEFLGENSARFPIQIYGTDICESAVRIARAGLYPDTASLKMSTDRLERFFRKEMGGYRIAKGVRDCCIFSLQDVTSQPPIIRLDLLSCRNLMIYLGNAVQKKLLDTFFYALNANGFLMLGAAESVGTAASLFSVVDKKYKIYTKKAAVTGTRPEPSPAPYHAPPSAAAVISPEASKLSPKKSSPVAEAERQVLDRFAPAWVLVDSTLDIVQFRGATAPYIEPARGQPTWNLMKMLHPSLWADIRMLIHSARKEGEASRKEGIKVKSGDTIHIVDVEVSPVSAAGMETHCLILFSEHRRDRTDSELHERVTKAGGVAGHVLTRENIALREELILSQKSLQAIIEDQNATNEELQSANEEVMSANEELQSTNEELETAKEELQSTNEELTTLNDELSSRNLELDHLSNDFLNLLSNASVSIVMVGLDLKIRRFTPMAEKLLKLIPADVGRSLSDINLGIKIDGLENKIAEVNRTLSTVELETQDQDGHWYSVRIRPYKTSDNKIDGAVLVFLNIDEMKTRIKLAKEVDVLSEGIIQTVRDPLVVLDESFRVERANHAFYDVFQVKSDETIGKIFFELGNRQWDIPELRNLIENVLPKKTEVKNYKVTHSFEKVGAKTLVLHARNLEWKGQKKLLILITLHDLTIRNP